MSVGGHEQTVGPQHRRLFDAARHRGIEVLEQLILTRASAQSRKVAALEAQAGIRGDFGRERVAFAVEGRAQRLVPPQPVLQRPFQGVGVEWSIQQ